METERRVCCENTAAVQVHLKHRRAVRQDQSLLIRNETEPVCVSGSGVMHTALGIRTYQGYLRLANVVSEGANVQFSGNLIKVERSEEHTSELQSLMRISYAVFFLKKKRKPNMLSDK